MGMKIKGGIVSSRWLLDYEKRKRKGWEIGALIPSWLEEEFGEGL